MTRTNDAERRHPNRAGLRARTDRALIRSTHRSERFVLVELDAPPATAARTREPVNLAFVLDRSGSMGAQKIELARRAIEAAIDRLLPEDRFAIVAYDDRVEVAVESTLASREAKDGAIRTLRTIDARGSTDLGGGWLRGAEQVAQHQVAPGAATTANPAAPSGAGIHRVLLLTDGLANVGMTDAGELATHAGELRARGIGTSTFGVGEDFDETLLQGMADAGGGHFYYIERPEQITDLIASEVGELLEIVARDAAIELTAPDGMSIGTLSPYRLEQHGNRTILRLGDLVAGQHIEAVIRIKFGYGAVGTEIGVLVGVSDSEGVLAAPGCAPVSVGWRYADDWTNDTQPRDRSVDRRVAGLFAARARQDAVKLNRLGDFHEAALEVRQVAERIRAYAGEDPELNGIVTDLAREEQRWAAPAPELARKAAFASANYTMRSRSPQGKAGRS